MTDAEEQILKNEKIDPIVAVANFALAKFLAKLNVAEGETKILEDELRALERDVKMRKIKTIINKE
ncbi:MAG: hypothetical protein A3J93_02030 [Candidatus Magasanikbacteria bacterium RIFOXYC2_FULL_42_28]|uniref:Uncharacterized protein n=1 Tax=Candidatus Magasanikbacteria bacterium RIFOXYC2_FULL_42_28 TaxID=1798704 RepID=A0A1F6NWF6_9BACT|nr:MAG: hypothetical protein A3J93_02030 [Candidatus Magasanikbacteria bacterium RIFOXYC2_FULL_42_28]